MSAERMVSGELYRQTMTLLRAVFLSNTDEALRQQAGTLFDALAAAQPAPAPAGLREALTPEAAALYLRERMAGMGYTSPVQAGLSIAISEARFGLRTVDRPGKWEAMAQRIEMVGEVAAQMVQNAQHPTPPAAGAGALYQNTQFPEDVCRVLYRGPLGDNREGVIYEVQADKTVGQCGTAMFDRCWQPLAQAQAEGGEQDA